jgi:hypothetical protein
MPWELTVRSELADPSSKSNDWPLLGSGEEVCRRISETLPTVEWWREPSFIEKHQHLPEDHPIRKHIETMTPEEREFSSRSQWKGLYQGGGFTLEFFFTDGPVGFFQIDVRGGGNPLPPLAAMCKANRWAIKDVRGDVVDLDLPSAPGWNEFTRWRDQVVSEITAEHRTEDEDD